MTDHIHLRPRLPHSGISTYRVAEFISKSF